MGVSSRWAMHPNQGTNLFFFINTTWHDMELHHHLSPQMQSLDLGQSSPHLWRQPQERVSHSDLVHYCKHGKVVNDESYT